MTSEPQRSAASRSQIEDFGCGISAADLPQFSNAFTGPTARGATEATAWACRWPKASRGRTALNIEVRSTEGEGSTFRVVFAALQLRQTRKSNCRPVFVDLILQPIFSLNRHTMASMKTPLLLIARGCDCVRRAAHLQSGQQDQDRRRGPLGLRVSSTAPIIACTSRTERRPRSSIRRPTNWSAPFRKPTACTGSRSPAISARDSPATAATTTSRCSI